VVLKDLLVLKVCLELQRTLVQLVQQVLKVHKVIKVILDLRRIRVQLV
jgi:hypothetical protein